MKLTDVNSQRLRELKPALRLPMNRIVNDILEKYFNHQLKEVAAMRVTEVEVMVSKKKASTSIPAALPIRRRPPWMKMIRATWRRYPS